VCRGLGLLTLTSCSRDYRINREEKMANGTVKWFSDSKDFGFIEQAGGVFYSK
jgi:hypothetical protein